MHHSEVIEAGERAYELWLLKQQTEYWSAVIDRTGYWCGILAAGLLVLSVLAGWLGL